MLNNNCGRKSFLSSSFIVFLISFFNRMVIRIVGEFSPSFLISAITFPTWIRKLDFKQDKILKYFTNFFLVLIAINILWMPFSDADPMRLIKCLAAPVNGLLVFLFLYFAYKTNPKSIKWAIAGTFLSMFVFKGELIENYGIEAGSYEYYKFLVYPRIVAGCLTACVLIKWYWVKKNAAIILIAVGLLGFATGSRSAGLIPFIAGITTLSVQHRRTSLKNIKKYLLVGFVVLYAAYAGIYVPNVLNGNIKEGNSQQLLRTENPYNPINLLMIGRSDAIVPFIAFMDKPIFGWGTDAKDTPNYKYNTMSVALSDSESDNVDQLINITNGRIPGHSTWGVYACYYGIFGFLAFFFMMLKLWKLTLRSMSMGSEHTLLILYFVLDFTWNILFSPGAIKLNSGSLALALVLISFTLEKERHNINNL